jgi:peptidoglycan/LPS O-acetylase OafA/YrhL
MLISINNPIQATWILTIILIIILIASARSQKTKDLFPISLTQELKGFAILAIIFSHIGYFLATDHRFLFPLSIFAGIGVDLFLCLSGFGLSLSAFNKQLTIGQFYKKNLLKLLTPFWISLILFFVLDFLILKIAYSPEFIWHSFVGFFPTADLYQDLNSPLWYFTIILLYYLLFPLIFSRKYPWISALFFYLAGACLIYYDPLWLKNVKDLYEVHLVAFPLGILMAWLFTSNWPTKLTTKINQLEIKSWLKTIGRYVLIAVLLFIIGYTAYYSGVGQKPAIEQSYSLITMSAIILLFLIKPIDFKLLSLLGLYSYEIYLLHWPILYRYDLLYKYFPAELATIIYLIVFLVLGFALKKLSDIILKNKTKNSL